MDISHSTRVSPLSFCWRRTKHPVGLVDVLVYPPTFALRTQSQLLSKYFVNGVVGETGASVNLFSLLSSEIDVLFVILNDCHGYFPFYASVISHVL